MKYWGYDSSFEEGAVPIAPRHPQESLTFAPQINSRNSDSPWRLLCGRPESAVRRGGPTACTFKTVYLMASSDWLPSPPITRRFLKWCALLTKKELYLLLLCQYFRKYWYYFCEYTQNLKIGLYAKFSRLTHNCPKYLE